MNDKKDEDDGMVSGTAFGREVHTYSTTIQELKELEETGCITTLWAEGPEDDKGECPFGVFRVRLRPREIWEYVDAIVTGADQLPNDLELLMCGMKPWRYERINAPDDQIWRDRFDEIGGHKEHRRRGYKLGIVEDPDSEAT